MSTTTVDLTKQKLESTIKYQDNFINIGDSVCCLFGRNSIKLQNDTSDGKDIYSYSFPNPIFVSSLDSVSLAGFSSENQTQASNWSFPLGSTLGAYELTISNIVSTGPYAVYIQMGSVVYNNSDSFNNPMYPLAPNGASKGTFFYVACDTQVGGGNTLNSQPVLTIRNIETMVRENTASPIVWKVEDCVSWLACGWIVPIEPIASFGPASSSSSSSSSSGSSSSSSSSGSSSSSSSSGSGDCNDAPIPLTPKTTDCLDLHVYAINAGSPRISKMTLEPPEEVAVWREDTAFTKNTISSVYTGLPIVIPGDISTLYGVDCGRDVRPYPEYNATGNCALSYR